MTTDKELLYAILSMDSYNREYGAGIEGLGGAGSKIGGATLLERPAGSDIDGWKSVGFYAAAYRLADGSTVISYRGTNDYDPFALGNDILNGWVAGAGTQTGQTKLAMEFYKNVTNRTSSRSIPHGFTSTEFTTAAIRPSRKGALAA